MVSMSVAVGVVCGRVIWSMLDLRSIFASTPMRESRIKLTIQRSPSSLDMFRVFESSLQRQQSLGREAHDISIF